MGQILAHNAYQVRTLDLTVGASPSVPKDCAAVLVLGPRDPLGPPEVAALTAYARDAGRLMVVASSLSTADPNPLVNPWGVSFAPTGPFWVSDNGAGLTTLYDGAGVKQGLVVTIPVSGNTGATCDTILRPPNASPTVALGKLALM